MTPNPRFQTTLATPTRDAVVVELHASMAEMIDLALQGKQLHWNIVGPRFQSIHEFLDELVDTYRGWSDDLAERCTALGVAPDGTAGYISDHSGLPQCPSGFQPDMVVAEAMAERVLLAAKHVRERAERLADLDPASEDLLLEILAGLEEQAWMLQAQSMTGTAESAADAEREPKSANGSAAKPRIGAAAS